MMMVLLLLLAVAVVALKITIFSEDVDAKQHDHSKKTFSKILGNNNTQEGRASSSFRKTSSLLLSSNNTSIILQDTTINTERSSDDDNDDDDWWKLLDGGWKQTQTQAQHALQQMETDKVFDTSVSYRDMVLKKGFPFRWGPCTIGNLLRRKQQQETTPSRRNIMQVAVLGGSSSARPGNNCTCKTTTSTEHQDLLAGRYSNILQRQLDNVYSFGKSNHDPWIGSSIHQEMKPTNNSVFQFQIVNMAQGAMDSPTNAILLDQLVNPHTDDILIHEFLINDFTKDTPDIDRIKRLRFWLTRVKALYAQAQKPLPPVLFVCLWTSGLYELEPNHLERQFLNAHPMKLFGRVLKEFEKLDNDEKWEFQVINVGAAVNMEWFKYRWHEMIDDGHHPSCMGTTLIANMLQHAIHQDIGMCKNTMAGETNSSRGAKSATVVSQKEKKQIQRPVTAGAPLTYHFWTHQEYLGTVNSKNYEALWKDLFREDAMTGSLTLWEPKHANMSSHLHILNREELFHHKPKIWYAKRAPNRQDRKYAWTLPHCSSAGDSFVVQLQEPYLKWLGIGKSNSTRPISIAINGVTVHDDVPDEGKGWGLYRIKTWIRMADYFDDNDELSLPPSTRATVSSTSSRNGDYNISLCTSGRDPAAMSFLVGVMIPPEAQ